MSDDALIRRKNLERWMKNNGVGVAGLNAKLGFGRDSYWRDLLGPNKSFGEKVARRIEEAANLPRGWLDTPQAGAAAAPPAVGPAAEGPPAGLVDFGSRRVSETEWQMLEDIRLVLQDAAEREAVMGPIKKRAAAIRALADEIVEQRMQASNPATVAERLRTRESREKPSRGLKRNTASKPAEAGKKAKP